MIWNDEFETLPREALESLQAKRLQRVAEKVYATVPFYRQQFDKAGVKPENIKSLDDLQRLPFTLKQDMRDNYPYGLFAKPLDQIVRIHASSGTTGKPTVVGYTRRDIDNWTELMARSFVAAGAHRGDVIHNAYGYGLFTGGLGAHYGAEKIGASVIPMSGGNTRKQLMIMQDFGSTVLTCTPSYSLFLAEIAAEEGIDISSYMPQPWTNEMVNGADVVVSMGCGDACPHVPATHRLDWDLPDPKGLDDDGFRRVRDEIERRVRSLLAAADAHREAGLAAVTGEYYAGGHWLGSFATYLLTAKGR